MQEIHGDLSPNRNESQVEDHKAVFKPRAFFNPRAFFTPRYYFPINTPSHSTYILSFLEALFLPISEANFEVFVTQLRRSVPYMSLLIPHYFTASLAFKVSIGFPISALIGLIRHLESVEQGGGEEWTGSKCQRSLNKRQLSIKDDSPSFSIRGTNIFGQSKCLTLRDVGESLWLTFFFFFKEFHFLFIYLFIYLYFWLCWAFVSVRGLSLVAASGGHSSSRCAGLSI